MTFDPKMAAHNLRMFKNRCGTLSEVCNHDDPACEKLSGALAAAYAEGLKRAEEIARANARRWIDPETVCNDIADEIAEERHAASAGRGK